MNAVLVVGALVLGLVFGSFLGGATWRVSRRESLLRPGSRCPRCGRRLRPWELVPVLSFLWQRGQCRGCGAPIGWRYPAVELATALLWALAAWRGRGHLADTVVTWAVSGLAVAAATTDLEHRRIPDPLVLAACALWVPLRAWAHRPSILLAAAGAGVFAGPLLLAAATRPDAMGLGDVKLALAFGLYLGWPLAAVALVLAATAGAAVGLVLIAAGLQTRREPIPFAPFMGAGSVAALLLGGPLVSWYAAHG